jgi:hypothetical protein
MIYYQSQPSVPQQWFADTKKSPLHDFFFLEGRDRIGDLPSVPTISNPGCPIAGSVVSRYLIRKRGFLRFLRPSDWLSIKYLGDIKGNVIKVVN